MSLLVTPKSLVDPITGNVTMKHRNCSLFLMALRACAMVSAIAAASAAWSADAVNVRFSWKLKGEYAPLYLAESQGMYAERNLAVRMGEGAGSQAALGALLQGQEDVVIMPAIFAISAIQKGMPLKIIALYQPKAPVVLISKPDKPVLKPKDLEGRTVAHSVGETGTSYLHILCAINAVDCGKVKKVQMDAQSRVPQFLQGQVDVVSVYVNNDLPMIESRVGTKFPTLSLAQYGLAIPGLSVVTSSETLAKKPDVLKRYLAAVEKALDVTRKDPKAAAAALGKAWQGSPAPEIVEAQVRATMSSIPPANAGKPTGWMEPAQIGQALELIKIDDGVGALKPAETFYTNELLPR